LRKNIKKNLHTKMNMIAGDEGGVCGVCGGCGGGGCGSGPVS
jgi:hypothetical protein